MNAEQTRAALLAAVRDNPDDDTPRLVYADWLDENAESDADHARAEFIRDQIALEHIPEYPPDAAAFRLRKELQRRSGVAAYTHKYEWLADVTAVSKLESNA